ncbi:capsule assembly Wzi family protein [Salegentibacter chungangensis]|uniref:Capsule assembly Wzi family protein n=1 Tax=Salegentibacter chungangensis TaxID=1335724 RepID=A0ABW3NN80_9FLAO
MSRKYFKQVLISLLFLLNFSSLWAQAIDFSGEARLMGAYSNKEELPFWMYSNQRGRIAETSNVSAGLNAYGIYNFEGNKTFEFGGGLAFSDGLEKELFIDEAYLAYSNSWLEVVTGIKHKAEMYNGLSASNRNILWSLNARALPGVQLGTNGTVFFKGRELGWGFEATLEEYWLGEDRYVKDAFLHHKSLHLVFKSWNGWKLKAGIQHFAQWGGTSPRFGKQPAGIEDYLRIFAGRAGGDNSLESDKANVLGNHLGSWELYVTREFKDFKARFIFNNLFEDGSGSRGANFPDGRYGVFIDFSEKDRIINSFIYEFYYTRDQSQTGPHLYDNYFNNGVYPSGWTYKSRILGVPFFTYDRDSDMVVNNKFSAHHFGVSGQFSTYFNTYPYKLMLSYAHNEGTFQKPLHEDGTNEDVFYFYSEVRLINRPFQLNIELGTEFNSYKEPVFGAGLHLSKSL